MADARLEPTESALLNESAERARARWERGYPGAIGDQALTASMEVLVVALSGAPGDPLPPGLTEPPSYVTVRQMLLDLLRSEFVRGLSPLVVDGTDPEQLVVTLRRFEEVRDALNPVGEHQIHAGLMGPQAPHILTEVGHDLRSPLTSVLFLSDALRAGHSGTVNSHQGRQLALIYSAALTMLTIVNNFMELSREGDGPTDAAPTPFSVADILDSIRSTVQPMADEKALGLELDVLMDGDRRVGHPVALSRVLLNLATNALKFTETGSVRMQARDVDEERVEFSVRDTGIGMSPEEREAIFNVFEPTVESGGVRFSGSGLGLVIVRKLLRSLDSELRCESEPDQGTRFSFRVLLPSPAD